MNNQISIKSLFYSFLLLLVLPNLAFILSASWLGDSRAIVNIDYLVPFILLVSRKAFVKSIGGALFVVVFLIDLLLLVLQHFPTFHFKDSLYLIGFILDGAKAYLIYAVAIIGLLAIEVILAWKLANKITFKAAVIIIVLLLFTNLGCHLVELSNEAEAKFYSTTLAKSNTIYFITNQRNNFSNLLGGDYLVATPYKHATSPWTELLENHKPLNKKLLLIVVESWGQPLNKLIQDDILKNLKTRTDLFDYYHEGSFTFRGFTVEGELRELCQLYPTTLDLFKIKIGFQNCLPHHFNDLGYDTEAIHGGNNTIYGRQAWWTKAGFKKVTFQENLEKPANCIPFAGICDWDIMPYIKQAFAQNKKQFIYWLTLTSHYEYYQHDIHNQRFHCSIYNIAENSDACRNLMLQAQFFDFIADFVASPEMRGVELIIVGDHPPPLFKANEIALFKTKEMTDGQVGWVHFKVKDKPSAN